MRTFPSLLLLETMAALALATPGLSASASAAQNAHVKNMLMRPLSAAAPMRKRALIIGIDDYWTARKLSNCRTDARQVEAFLLNEWKFPRAGIRTITDQDRPSKNTLRNAVDSFVRSLHPGDEVVFFFSGHGAQAGGADFLVPIDGYVGNIAGSCISYSQIRLDLERMKLGRALLITDACRELVPAEIVRKRKSMSNINKFGSSPPSKRLEFAELRSCRAGQISLERMDGRGSVFTFNLLQALRGARDAISAQSPTKGTVTFDSLSVYVERTTAYYVATHYPGEEQSPFGYSSYGGMVLCKNTIVHEFKNQTDSSAQLRTVLPVPPKASIVAANRLFDEAFVEIISERGTAAVWQKMQRALEQGATAVNMVDEERRAGPLHYAAWYNKTAVARLLLQRGLDIRQRNGDSCTPLHCAASANAVDVARLFIAHHADLNAKTTSGLTPLGMAKRDESVDVIALLKAAGAH